MENNFVNNKDEDNLIIYWCPASYVSDYEIWASLYRDPVPVLNLLRPQKTSNIGFFSCPATKDYFNNVFTVLSNLDDTHELPVDLLKTIHKEEGSQDLITNGKITLTKVRATTLDGYSNLLYNMKWFFFSEQPVLMKFTSPYFPNVSPAKGSLLSTGQFDIGQWPRLLTLDYHIPLDVNFFEIKEGDPLFYLHIETDKKIEFKRIVMSTKLLGFTKESSESPGRYGKFKLLKERYKMAQQANIREQVLSEIKKNLI